VEFESDELGFLLACIGKGVSVAAGEPLHVPGVEVAWHGALAFDVAAHVEIGDRDHEVRAGMVMAGYGRTRLQLDLGDAHAILHKDDVLRAAGEDVQAAFFIPLRGRVFVCDFVLQQFDGHVAKRLVRQIARDVGEIAGPKPDLAILQFHRGRRLAFHFVREVRGPERNIDIVMVMDVHQRGIVRCDLYLEHADIFVFKRPVMARLASDFDLGLLCSQGDGGEYERRDYQAGFHESRF